MTDFDNSREWASQAYAILKKQQAEQKEAEQKEAEQKEVEQKEAEQKEVEQKEDFSDTSNL